MLSRNKTDENNMSELRMIKKQKLLILLMTTDESADHNNIFYTFQELSLFLIKYSFILYDNTIEREFFKRVFYPHGEIFFQNSNGARYLDPKYSRWISTDPALGDYVPQAPVNDEAKKHNQNLPGMGGLFNTVNLSLYHYAGNNPVKYVDPDGRFVWVVVPLIIGGISLFITSDKQPSPTPVNADAINKKLANIFYDDPSMQKGNVLTSPYGSENSKSLVLESHPVLALSGALPRGSYSEGDYVNPNQLKGKSVQTLETSVGGLGLAATIVENLSKGHLGDITLTYKTNYGKITSWLMTLTTINPLTGDTSGRQVFSREEALKYRHGARQKNLSLSFIKNFIVPVPPLSLQQEFAEKVEAIERQKALVQQSIEETQTMFDYTMDKYFG